MDKELQEFIDGLKGVKGNRVHKIKNSLGVYDAFKYYRKTRNKESKYRLTESQYFSIIRMINQQLAELLSKGNDALLPCRMGRLEIRKKRASLFFDGGELKTNLPVDWSSTFKLWYDDREAYNNKTLIRIEEKEIYRVFYNKRRAQYKNKVFYTFEANRELKKNLKYNIKEGIVDAFMI